MTDRLYIAAEVTRRLDYIRNDTLELARLLRGETLSQEFHETLTAIIRDLQQVADSAMPAATAQQVLPGLEPDDKGGKQPSALEPADAA